MECGDTDWAEDFESFGRYISEVEGEVVPMELRPPGDRHIYIKGYGTRCG